MQSSEHEACRSSVVEHLCIRQAVLGLIPSGDQIFLIVYVKKSV